MFPKIFRLILKHKIITGIILLLIIGGGYFGYQKLTGNNSAVRYAIAAVGKGTLIVSVSGSGQVSAADQIDLKPKVSGDVVYIGIKAGQEVKVGQALLSIDDADAKKEISDAELSIEEAQLNLDKAIAQASIDYESKLDSLQTAEDDLAKEYEDVFSTVSNVFLSLPTIMTYAQNILYGTELSANKDNVDAYNDLFTRTADRDLVSYFAEIAKKDYKTSRDAYDNNFLQFKSLTIYSSESEKEEMSNITFDTSRAIAQSIKSEINLLDTIVDIAKQRNKNLNSTITTFQTNLRTFLTTANNNLSTLLSQQSSLKNAKATITSAENAINILKINNPTGINPIDLQISKNNIEQKKAALTDLKAKLADYVVYAPFSGIITEVNVKKGDSVSSGTTLATLITQQKIAEITLNEIDVAKIKVEQKVTVTFDAIENFSITGEVAEIDTVGTVSQGVVSYNVKIGLDTENERVKPGMSLSTTIITDVKQNALLVSNSAVKQQGDMTYVEVVDENLSNSASANVSDVALTLSPRLQQVEVGLSNDTQVEIISGLEEGDKVITQTINSGATSQSQFQRNTGLRIPGL